MLKNMSFNLVVSFILTSFAEHKQSDMNLSYDQAEERITLMHKNHVIYKAAGKAAALAFVALEMGRATNIYHKLAEGVDAETIRASVDIQDSILKHERLRLQ